MRLEVIRGTPARGVGSITTSYFAPRDLVTRFENWATVLNMFEAPNGGRRWFPFKGPGANIIGGVFAGNTVWPAPIIAYRLVDIHPVIYSQIPEIKTKIDPAGVTAMRAGLIECLEQHIRNRETLLPTQPIPDAAWNVADFPFTHNSGNIFEAFVEGLASFFAKFNPALVLGRAGMLALTVRNYKGLATKMAANDPERVRLKWQAWGGNWAMLRDAINEGKTKQPVNAAPKPQNPMDGSGAASGQFGAWMAAAKPILDVILSALGISLDGGTQAENNSTNNSATQQTTTAMQDTTAPPPKKSGGALVWVVLGGGLLLALASSPSTQRHGKA